MKQILQSLRFFFEPVNASAGEDCTNSSFTSLETPETEKTEKRSCSRVMQQQPPETVSFDIVSGSFFQIVSTLVFSLFLFSIYGAPAVEAAHWSTSEGTLIQNGLDPGDTFPSSDGELSVRFENVGGGVSFESASNVAGTEVTHLSEVQFSGDTPVVFVSPGDSAILGIRLDNIGNGPDTYALSGSLSLNDWDTAIHLDQNGDSILQGTDLEVSVVSRIVSLGNTFLLLRVDVPAGVSTSTEDTFTVTARSLRSEDPTPGTNLVNMRITTDTSSVDVFNPNPPFAFVDTQAITNDTSVSLRFPAISEVDEQNVTYFDTSGQVSQTGFHNHVTGDSAWTLTDREGTHTFKVQYKFNNGQFSDTFTDTIKLDHTAPSDSQLQINNGDTSTVSLNVNLNPFLASDTHWVAGNGSGRVVIDNDSSFTTADVDTRVMPASGDRSGDSWTVSTAGKVFAKFIDAAGNVSGIISDTILIDLDTTQLDQTSYVGLLAEARVTINDFGANENPGAIDDTTVIVTSELDPDGITVRVVETSPNSGQFEGTFGFTEGFSDDAEDKIFVEPNAQITVTYVNSSGQTSSDSATWTRDPSSATTVKDVRTWPNPFHPLDGNPFVFQNLPADDGLEIRIFNVSGQLVRRLTVGRGIEFNSNGNIARWFGRNDVGDRVASGRYIYVVNSKFGTKRGKLTLVK